MEAFRQFGRGRPRAALYQRCGGIMPLIVRGVSVNSGLPEDAPYAALRDFFKGEAYGSFLRHSGYAQSGKKRLLRQRTGPRRA
jgi:hypothetical protein